MYTHLMWTCNRWKNTRGYLTTKVSFSLLASSQKQLASGELHRNRMSEPNRRCTIVYSAEQTYCFFMHCVYLFVVCLFSEDFKQGKSVLKLRCSYTGETRGGAVVLVLMNLRLPVFTVDVSFVQFFPRWQVDKCSDLCLKSTVKIVHAHS